MNNGSTRVNIYWELMQLAVRSRHDFARLAEKEYGLTGPQMHSLCLLEPYVPSPMNTLSCQMACDASNITGIADRLVAQGYVERRDDPADRRVKHIVLTKTGIALRAAFLAQLMQVAPAGIANLSQAEAKQLQELLQKALLAPHA